MGLHAVHVNLGTISEIDCLPAFCFKVPIKALSDLLNAPIFSKEILNALISFCNEGHANEV